MHDDKNKNNKINVVFFIASLKEISYFSPILTIPQIQQVSILNIFCSIKKYHLFKLVIF